MTLYSHNGARPAPLPTTPTGTPRIRVPAGAGWRTRTGTFTPEELAAAGYVEAGPAPLPTARQLEAEWVDGAWVLPDKPLGVRLEKLKEEIDAERNRRIYLPIGSVDVRGDGSLLIEPDIRNERDEANLIALSLRATQLKGAGITAAVIPFGAADNVEYQLTPTEMITLAAAPFARASGLFVRGRQLKDAAVAAIDHDGFDRIDADAGSIQELVQGVWVAQGAWPTT